MTIDEAIKREKERSEMEYRSSSAYSDCDSGMSREYSYHIFQAQYHEQLAEWLEELKEYRENIGILIGKEKGKAYKQGRQDAIEDFKKYLLRHKHLVSEYETNYKYEAVKIEFITDTNDLFLAEQMKEGAENGF